MDLAFVSQLERFNKLLASTKGRDRVTKLLQSGSKMYAHSLESSLVSLPEPTRAETALLLSKCTAFDGSLTSARKVFRLGTFLSGIVAIYNIFKKDLQMEQYLDLTSKLGIASYQFLDGLNWMAKIKILSNTDSLLSNGREEQYGTLSNQMWFVGIVANLIQVVQQIKSSEGEKRNMLILQAIGLICDALCALNGAKHVILSKGTVGTLSVVSALVGIYETY
jgi:hypothetical protein